MWSKGGTCGSNQHKNKGDCAMNQKTDVLNYLKGNHRGEEQAVSSKELEQLFSLEGRSVRRIISALRQEGHPICSSQKGYYYAASQQEINETIARLNEFVTGISNSRTGLLFAKASQNYPTIEITIRVKEERDGPDMQVSKLHY
ncbi:MAG: HTH domain-containing protein [Eubacterium sp.]|nr:HTH domain-containing protein [Clostridia bacterium]MBQ5959691.1 HTH domain-containing protein [Bacillota bacterium]MBQ9871019.1 HTH domain-containing protein [Eubacterium sp.]